MSNILVSCDCEGTKIIKWFDDLSFAEKWKEMLASMLGEYDVEIKIMVLDDAGH